MTPERATLWLSQFVKMVLVWPFLEPTKPRIVVWDAALSDLGEDQIREGVARLIANHGASTPSPGELRDAVLGKLSWQTVRHDVDGRVMGRREVRALSARELPAPEPLIDLDREPLSLNGALGSTFRQLSDGMRRK